MLMDCWDSNLCIIKYKDLWWVNLICNSLTMCQLRRVGHHNGQLVILFGKLTRWLKMLVTWMLELWVSFHTCSRLFRANSNQSLDTNDLSSAEYRNDQSQIIYNTSKTLPNSSWEQTHKHQSLTKMNYVVQSSLIYIHGASKIIPLCIMKSTIMLININL